MEKDNQNQLVFGAPIIGNGSFLLSSSAPLGQKDLFLAVQAETKDPTEIFRALIMEYVGVLTVLLEMGLQFKVIWAYEEAIERATKEILKELPLEYVRLPNIDPAVLMYPRDLILCLPRNISLVSNSSALKKSKKSKAWVINSVFGEGGMVLFSPQVRKALVCEQLFLTGEEALTESKDLLGPFATAGVEVAMLPNPVTYEWVGNKRCYGLENHMDRIAGMLTDKQGKTHLVVDPKLYSGFAGTLFPPHFGPEQTLKRWREECDKLGIEIHVPSALSIPMSVGFWQAPDGRVLLTSGDDEVAEIVADIVGEENVFLTHAPLRYLAAWCKAGLHCLINEIPPWVINLLPQRSPY